VNEIKVKFPSEFGGMTATSAKVVTEHFSLLERGVVVLLIGIITGLLGIVFCIVWNLFAPWEARWIEVSTATSVATMYWNWLDSGQAEFPTGVSMTYQSVDAGNSPTN